MTKLKFWQKEVKGWVVPIWYTDTPLVSRRAAEYGLGKLATKVRESRKRDK